MTEQDKTVQFFGAMWCGDTRRARGWFDQHQIPYRWIDIDEDADAAERVRELNNGFRSIPTLLFHDGSRLVEPSTSRLEEHARKLGLLSPPQPLPPVTSEE